MNSKLICLISFFSFSVFSNAQSTIALLDTSMFDKQFQTIPVTQLHGWIFKQGNDTDWAKNEIDTTGWKKLNPSELTAKDADKNGKLEGWLRLNFTLNKSFANFPIGIESSRWAAVDIYIDGKYVKSYGNTGMNGQPFEENTEVLPVTQPLDIEVGRTHLLAIHIVEFVEPFTTKFLKSSLGGQNFGSFIILTGPLKYKNTFIYNRERVALLFLYSAINGILSILFWFLYLLDRREKNLLVISISTSLFFIWPVFLTIAEYPLNMNFTKWWLTFYFAVELWPIAMASMLYTVGKIFRFRYMKALAIFVVLFLIYCFNGTYSAQGDFDYKFPPVLIATCLLCIGLSSWKKLKGAQWAVVLGITLTAIFSFTWSNSGLYENGMFLSFPVSLMFYIIIRFREILKEVELNAHQVMQLSEERKEQAIQQQKILEEEVARQTIELRTSLENLKSTQAQLIQSEKMASLGELTAGIAHEIQNPLNFVNNFSEVNKELAEELKSELAVGNLQLAADITNDIKDNSEKINHHGKRADAIVKGMLQHSQKNSGEKVPTDINALCDEYLRLAYHGLRAKDKSFNATLKTDFDTSTGKVNIIPQDIGRVLLNLYNNAFYTVNEKAKQQVPGYEPAVTVVTRQTKEKTEIKVEDNGNGIPQNIVGKIFQPFFTTKPTGQGTGLGLSLTYDIIRALGGEIKVETKEGEGTNFVIQLPNR